MKTTTRIWLAFAVWWGGVITYDAAMSAIYDSGPPPARFAYIPKVKPEIIWTEPTKMPCGAWMQACATWWDDGSHPCIIHINIRHTFPLEAILLHEYAHCNGWPADHPRP